MQRFLILLLLLFAGDIMYAHSTRVKGKVIDAKTGEPLPLVNIVFKGTTIGITSDFNGEYTLETREEVSELQASSLGYILQTVKINPGNFNTVNFRLEPQAFDLEEVQVVPGENPAHAILKKIRENKVKNDPGRFPQYSCQTYTKMELDLTNIKPGFKNKKLQEKFGFVFDHMDTSAITGKAYLPVMISESSADYSYRKSPALPKTIYCALACRFRKRSANLKPLWGMTVCFFPGGR